MALTKETKRRLADAVEQSVGRAIASEAIAYDLLSLPVDRATDELVSRIVAAGGDAPSQRRAAMRGIGEVSAKLAGDFGVAAARSRSHSRALARNQVTAELEDAAKVLGELEGRPLRPPAVLPAPDTRDQDAASAHSAGLSMAQRWNVLAFGALMGWKRDGAPSGELPRRFIGLKALSDPAVRTHAATGAADAFADEHRAVLRVVVKVPPPLARDDRVPRFDLLPGGRQGGGFDTGAEQGLPYGWGQGMFEIWSAVLDRATCPRCWSMDGHMVPIGKEWSLGRMPLHARCRCTPISLFIPEALSRKLPGIQIDYSELKHDVRDYMRGSKVAIGSGIRHAHDYISEALKTSSPQKLTKKFMDPQRYFPNRRQQRAPRVGGM